MKIVQRYLRWLKHSKVKDSLFNIGKSAELLSMYQSDRINDLNQIEFQTRSFNDTDNRVSKNISFQMNEYKWRIHYSISSFGQTSVLVVIQINREDISKTISIDITSDIWNSSKTCDITSDIYNHINEVESKLMNIREVLISNTGHKLFTLNSL